MKLNERKGGGTKLTNEQDMTVGSC